MGIDLTLKEHQRVEAVSEIKLGLSGMSAERRQYMRPMAVESCGHTSPVLRIFLAKKKVTEGKVE